MEALFWACAAIVGICALGVCVHGVERLLARGDEDD